MCERRGDGVVGKGLWERGCEGMHTYTSRCTHTHAYTCTHMHKPARTCIPTNIQTTHPPPPPHFLGVCQGAPVWYSSSTRSSGGRVGVDGCWGGGCLSGAQCISRFSPSGDIGYVCVWGGVMDVCGGGYWVSVSPICIIVHNKHSYPFYHCTQLGNQSIHPTHPTLSTLRQACTR